MRHRLIIVGLFVLSLFFVQPFFKSGYFETDDGMWAIVRQASMHNELRERQFPVRWSGNLNFGYGYPLFQFSYPGPYYIGELFHLVGLSFTDTIKVLFVAATVLSVITMYVFARNLWKNDLAGVIAALFYLAAPYRFVNLYVRGSLGETIAFLLFPLACYLGLKILLSGKRRYVIAGSATFALIIITHNVMALLFVPFFIYFLAVETAMRNVKFRKLFNDYIDEIKNKKNWYKQGYTISALYKHIAPVIVMVILGITLSASFWFPALAELQYVKLGTTPLTSVSKEFEKQEGLLLTPLDSHPTVSKSKAAAFEENLEFDLFILAIMSIGVFVFYRNKYTMVLHRILLYSIPLLISLVLLTPIAISLWQYLPGLKTVDFPWRIFGLISFIAPVIIASTALVDKIKYIALTCAVISLLLSTKLITPGKYHDNPDSYYSTNQATTTSADEYVSRWTSSAARSRPEQEITLINGQAVEEFSFKAQKIMSTTKQYSYNSSSEVEALFRVMYFPGWELRIDGVRKLIDPRVNNGIISTRLPKGTHTVTLTFNRTPARFFGDAVTLAGIIGIGILCTVEYARGKKFVL